MSRHYCLSIIIALLLVACSGVQQRTEHADQLAATAGFRKTILDTGFFKILTYSRVNQGNNPVTFYIEGDGKSFVNRYRPSANPTPGNPLALKLAVLDSSDSVVYLARPCQFVSLQNNPHCASQYWTSKRYAKEVITALDAVIDDYKGQLGFTRIRLVGYSGGATVASIIAATRTDVMDLRTLAGNLDIEAFTTQHNVTPLTGSLNPVDFARVLARIPQRHLLGLDDKVITATILNNYLKALEVYDPSLQCISIKNVDDTDHAGNWETIWLREQLEPPMCK